MTDLVPFVGAAPTASFNSRRVTSRRPCCRRDHGGQPRLEPRLRYHPGLIQEQAVVETVKFCPRCAHPMADRARSDANGIRITRRVCSETACGFVQWSNPTPAVGALVEHQSDIILARNA